MHKQTNKQRRTDFQLIQSDIYPLCLALPCHITFGVEREHFMISSFRAL